MMLAERTLQIGGSCNVTGENADTAVTAGKQPESVQQRDQGVELGVRADIL